jgi:hypothetical protein
MLVVPSVAVDNYFDKNASTITNYDLKLMEEFDKLAYDLSDVELKSLDIKTIYNYIRTHKSYITDYSLAKVDFKASAGIDDYDYAVDRERDKNYKKTSIQLTYPLFDQKSRKDIKNKKIEYNFKILDELNKYTKLRDSLVAIIRELKFNRLIQIKEKLQVKKGIKYLDDKLKTIEKILKLQNDILDIKSNLIISETTLLNYVKPNARAKLKELLF